MSDQNSTFLWKRDFKDIHWQATLKYNLFRALAAAIVWFAFELLAGAGLQALSTLIVFPIAYFIFFLPIGLLTAWLSGIGVPFIGLVNIFFALMLIVGDPLLFFLKKARPEWLPIDRPKFVNFKLVMFIINEPAEGFGASKRELSAAMFKK